MAQRKTTTAADIAAAIALGVMPEDAEIVTAEAAAKMAAEAAEAARTDAIAMSPSTTTATPEATAEHRCTQRGCRHGDHSGTPQPDRQLKMIAPCGAVLRMTPRALGRAGGGVTCAHGDAFAIDTTRRAYGRKTTTETAAQ